MFLSMAVWSQSALAEAGEAAQDAATGVDAVDLTIANRRIVTLRAQVSGASPADRVLAIRERVDLLVERGGPLELSTREMPEGIAVLMDGNFVFRVLHADVDPESGETAKTVAAEAVRNLSLAIDEIREGRDARAMLIAAGYALLATLVLVGLLWLVRRGYAWLAPRLRDFVHRRSARLAPAWGSEVVGRVGLPQLAVMPLRLLAWIVALLLIYEWLGLVLGFFPYTRPWGETLLGSLLDALGGFGMGILRSLPDLLFVLLIFVVTRFIVRVVRVFFDGVQAGRVHVGWVDETTARPTERLMTAIIWLFALVAAYPYLPGSGSEAFKGIGVFVGLMLSIGASGVVNQAVSGLMLMYTRALRPGEFVQIGDTEGTVDLGRIPGDPYRDVAARARQHPELGHRQHRDAQLLAPRGRRRRPAPHQAHDRLRHALAPGAGDAADGRGAHVERDPRAAAARAADGAAGFLRRVHAARERHGSGAEVRRAQRAARPHPGRIQRVRRADHVAQLRGRPGRSQTRAEGAVVRGARREVGSRRAPRHGVGGLASHLVEALTQFPCPLLQDAIRGRLVRHGGRHLGHRVRVSLRVHHARQQRIRGRVPELEVQGHLARRAHDGVLDARRHDVRRVDLDVEQRRPQHEHIGRGDIDHLVAALALEFVGEDFLELRTEALFHLLDVRVGDPAESPVRLRL
jgi:small-conductance mechanosensitive channel